MSTKDYSRVNLWSSKNTLKNKILANFYAGAKFITLTFHNINDFDITSLRQCNKRHGHFIRRLARKYPHLKYVTVPEFQKRGAVHYHIICNIPFVKKAELSNLWGHGFVRINRIERFRDIVSYLTKYMSKNLEDSRFIGHRKYYCSTKLIKPRKLWTVEAEDLLRTVRDSNLKPFHHNRYMSEYCGLISLEKFNLDDLPAQQNDW